MTFLQKLDAIVAKNNSLLCIGLDSDIRMLPLEVKKEKHPQYTFNKAIIDATHDLVCAYKPNSAFYEARGAKGIEELKMTCDYIRKKYPAIPIILDAKRADIGSTNDGYVQYAFDYLGTDAITLHPYLGREALAPFLNRKDKCCFILCRTSNSGAGELQDLKIGSKPLYQIVAKRVVNSWNTNNNCGLVVGATYPNELKIVRRIAKNLPFLIPGIGFQGGNLKQSVQTGLDSYGRGIIIAVSRSIIFASRGKDFALQARREALALKNTINQYKFMKKEEI